MRNGPYELVVAPDDFPGKRYRGRYCYEHTLVWWQNTGKVPPPGYVVHHKNESKRDNRFENLDLKTNGEHTAEHHPRVCMESVLCGNCGREYLISPRTRRYRVKISKSGRIFCSKSCNALFHGLGKKNAPVPIGRQPHF